MLCLSQKDLEQSVSCKELIDAIESAFVIYEENRFKMPDRAHIDFDENTFLLMPYFPETRLPV